MSVKDSHRSDASKSLKESHRSGKSGKDKKSKHDDDDEESEEKHHNDKKSKKHTEDSEKSDKKKKKEEETKEKKSDSGLTKSFKDKLVGLKPKPVEYDDDREYTKFFEKEIYPLIHRMKVDLINHKPREVVDNSVYSRWTFVWTGSTRKEEASIKPDRVGTRKKLRLTVFICLRQQEQQVLGKRANLRQKESLSNC